MDRLIKTITNTGDRLSLRVSLDSFHRKALGDEIYQDVVSMSKIYSTKSISFAFRSLLEEKEKIRKFLRKVTGKVPHQTSLLDDILNIGHSGINITYKNIVSPPVGYCATSMRTYIDLLSEKYQKPFTIGSLAAKKTHSGLDVTIKPDGKVYYYGAENTSYGNINFDDISIETLVNNVKEIPLLTTLYTIPFKYILDKLSCSELDTIVKNINNPYWLVKSLPKKFIKTIEMMHQC